MIYVFLANGFEEVEALTPVDFLRRCELDVRTVGVNGSVATGSHRIAVACDMTVEEMDISAADAVILPGGMPGTLNLERSPVVQAALDQTEKRGGWIFAICAAPSILGHRGMLKGRRAVCFPGFEQELEGAILSDRPVEADGRLITARGPGAAIEFGLRIVEEMVSPERAAKLKAAMQCR